MKMLEEKIDEIDEVINNTILSLKGKNIEKKIKSILFELNVCVCEEEVKYDEEVLKAIIKARMINKCLECGGKGYKNLIEKIKCPICEGRGWISQIDVEKKKLENIRR